MTSATFDAALQRVNNPNGVLELLEITHPSFSAPMRIVNDTRNVDSGGVTYVAYPFRITLPQDVKGEAPRCTIEIDNTGRDLTGELEALPANSTLECAYRIADRSTPDTIEYAFSLPLSRASVNVAVISAVIGVDHLMRLQAVRKIHDPTTSPGIF